MSIIFPLGHNPHEIVQGCAQGTLRMAARERDAEGLSGKPVVFATEMIEPPFPTEAAARQHYADILAKGFSTLVCGFERSRKLPKPLKPVMRDGQRWPEAAAVPPLQWRLSIRYWKIVTKRAKPVANTGTSLQVQARAARKKALDVPLTPEEVLALAHAPLMAYRPQKALDIGLFEMPLPENPAIIIADE